MMRGNVSTFVFILALVALGRTVMSEYNFAVNETLENSTFNLAMFQEMKECVTGWQPCSFTIVGNLILVLLYGVVLGYSAKLISDGAELLLDLGLPAAIIGGVVLPLLGAVPDSAMIVASGIGGDRDDAQKEINVGMGTLAGSTIMLLTIPWLASLIIGRVDIVNGEGIDNKCSKFSIKSLWKQGITVCPDVTRSAIVMLITTIPYFIVQGADWHFGPTKPFPATVNGTVPNPPNYMRYTSLATAVLAFVFFIAYLVYQILDSVSSKRKAAEKQKELIKRRVIRQFYLTQQKMFAKTSTNDDSETKPLLNSEEGQKHLENKYFKTWKVSKGLSKKKEEEEEEKKAEQEEEKNERKWKIALKSFLQMIIGVVLVTLFSDPMAGALTAITDKTHTGYYGNYIPIGTFYVSFVVTPICSNASELISSLMFAAKKKKINSSMTYSQLYGAATMNNTLCLGIFAILVYARELNWEYSAEVTVIILIEFAVGLTAIFAGFLYKHTYMLFLGIFIGALYILSLVMIAVLENVANWK